MTSHSTLLSKFLSPKFIFIKEQKAFKEFTIRMNSCGIRTETWQKNSLSRGFQLNLRSSKSKGLVASQEIEFLLLRPTSTECRCSSGFLINMKISCLMQQRCIPRSQRTNGSSQESNPLTHLIGSKLKPLISRNNRVKDTSSGSTSKTIRILHSS